MLFIGITIKILYSCHRVWLLRLFFSDNSSVFPMAGEIVDESDDKTDGDAQSDGQPNAVLSIRFA